MDIGFLVFFVSMLCEMQSPHPLGSRQGKDRRAIVMLGWT